MRVIYIASASHSGSTLLDMMLNAHPQIISVGEVLKLNQIKLSDTGKPKLIRCSCGARGLLQCEFWSRVSERIKEKHGKCLTDLDVNEYDKCDERQEPNSVLFRALSEVSGKDFIVDSSKNPRRLAHLLRFDALNTYPIYLIRNPMGQVASVIASERRTARHGLMKAILYYEVVHSQIRRTLRSIAHSVARYEDLVLDPERTLQRILEPLGLKFHPRQLEWAEQAKHSFAGNHVRWQAESDLVLDERWKRCLTPAQKLLIHVGTVLSRHAGP